MKTDTLLLLFSAPQSGEGGLEKSGHWGLPYWTTCGPSGIYCRGKMICVSASGPSSDHAVEESLVREASAWLLSPSSSTSSPSLLPNSFHTGSGSGGGNYGWQEVLPSVQGEENGAINAKSFFL